MIPRYEVDVYVDVDFGRLEYPDEETVGCKDGLGDNHDYIDMRGESWDGFLHLYKMEREIIAHAGIRAESVEDFERILNEKEGEDPWAFDGHDIGIASATVAISAFDCAPVYSCRAHPEGGMDDHPHVSFWAEKREAEIIRKVALKTGVGLVNECIVGDFEKGERDGLDLYSTNVKDLMNFGHALYLVGR